MNVPASGFDGAGLASAVVQVLGDFVAPLVAVCLGIDAVLIALDWFGVLGDRK